MPLLASAADLPTLTTIAAVVRLSGLQPTTWDRLGASLGNPPDLRILSMLPAEVLQKAIQDLQIVTGTPPTDGSVPTTREPNATERIQMALVWSPESSQASHGVGGRRPNGDLRHQPPAL